MPTTPKVSIGLPVYNGAKYLRLALDSLRNQDYPNLDLLISDNASTDGSADICSEYAQNDPRIRFFRNERNIGAAKNFNRVFKLATGKYFMWAAHDDLWEPNFISKCVAALEKHPSVVLCGTDVRFINQIGQPVTGRGLKIVGGNYNRLNTLNFDLRRRVSELTRELNWYAIYGVIRSDALKNTELSRGFYGSDVILLMELLLQGETLILPEPLFHYRIQKKSASDQLLDITGHNAQALRASPYTELAGNLLAVIERSDFTNTIKVELMDDLLANVSRKNRRWQKRILKEHPETNHKSPFERARNIRKLLAPTFVEPNPSGRFQVALEERLSRVNEFGAKIRRNFGRLTGQ
jgi:glycosyltransferase involved in cell wall biosynthesis